MPVKYNKIEHDKISLGKPVKDGETRKCRVYYDDVPFVIQTPKKIKIDEEDKLLFSLNKKGVFYSCLDDVKNKIVDILAKGDFFKKSFTTDYILKSLTPFIFVNDNGDGEIPVKLTNTKWVNYFMETTEPCYNKSGSCLLHLKAIVFFKNSVSFETELMSIKLDPESNYGDKYNDYMLEEQEGHEEVKDDLSYDNIDNADNVSVSSRGEFSNEIPTIIVDDVNDYIPASDEPGNLTETEDFFCD